MSGQATVPSMRAESPMSRLSSDSASGGRDTSTPSSGSRQRRPPRPPISTFNQNIVTVLNDPTRPREPDMFTRDWGDGFVPIPVVPPLPGVRNYRYEDFSAARNPSKRGGSRGNALTHAHKHEAKRAQPTAAKVVPKVFFEDNFDITLPETFVQVLLPADAATESTSELQEQFSHYLDTVEQELSSAISDRSDRFFAALGAQQALNAEVLQTLDKIHRMRSQLIDVQCHTSDRNLDFIRQLKARENAFQLHQKLNMLSAVSQTQSTIQLLLATSDFVGALDLISTTKEILRSELNGLHCLKHLDSQLHEMHKVVHVMMQQEFINALLDDVGDMRGGLDHVATHVTLPDLLAAHQRRTRDEEEEERCEKLKALLAGITRHTGMHFAFASPYKKAVFAVLQDLMSQRVQAAAGATEAGRGGGTAGGDVGPATHKMRLRQMEFEDWRSLLENLSKTLFVVLLQIHTTHQKLSSVLTDLITETRHGTRTADISAVHCTVTAGGISTPLVGNGSTSGHSGSGGDDDHTTPTTVNSDAGVAGDGQARDGNDLNNDGNTDDDGFADPMYGISEEDPGAHAAADAVAAQQLAASALDILDGKASAPGAKPTPRTADVSESGTSTHAAPAPAASTTPTSATSSEDPGSTWTEDRLRELLGSSKRVLSDVCEEMHSRLSKLILARKHEQTDLSISVDMFVSEFRVVFTFIAATETVNGKPCATLRGTVLSQAKKFMEYFHSKQKEKLAHLLANERWTRANVPAECQDVIAWITDPERLLDSVSLTTSSSDTVVEHPSNNTPASNDVNVADTASPSTSPTRPAGAAHTVSKTLTIGGQEVRAVGALLMYLRVLKDYVRCAVEMQPLAQEIMARLLENIRSFNQRTKMLVLEMGAINIVGLSTISAKNLALASQALTAVILLMESIRKIFVNLLPEKTKTFAQEFDRVKQDYDTHRKAIASQLVSIMQAEWERQAPSMNYTRMSTTPGAKQVAANSKQLHKVLKGVLHRDEIADIFRSILGFFNSKLKLAAKERGGQSKAIAVGMAADIVHFEEVLGGLDGMPIQVLREGLSELGLVLPALVREVT
eukprot:m.1054671 g.1054671  ORF g.1054671 m.1054671 type:complete len:1074 (+) comp24191_c0_seq1:218-3439(+)